MWKFLFGILFVLGLFCLAGAYKIFYAPNINAERRIAIKIPTGSTYQEVMNILHKHSVLKNEWTFEIVSRWKYLDQNIKPGYYVLTRGMDNRLIVNTLRMGWQTPVTLVIYNVRTKEEFSGLVGHTLEIDSNKLLAKLNDETFCKTYERDTNNILSRFILDNYEFYWNTSLEKFMQKTETAYHRFWDEERMSQANALHLSPTQIVILASIVEKEVIFDKELSIVAGVYLNRLRIGMPLQADPTLVFARRDFKAQRVNATHRAVDSPYNTYKNRGLPPGPICLPRKKSIDAVLNAEKHPYLYFCANPDMSGNSIFSKTLTEQNKIARQYRKTLDKMNIH
ncbi:MAG: endolytic transglycosylase MltG [Bacteroidetes bacterium]|nr:endolytic transglycosylase MltG [Bacteroidota bacterium]